MSSVLYNKSIKNLGAFRDALYNTNLLNSVEIINISSSNSNFTITYDNTLTTQQNTDINTFVNNYQDVSFVNEVMKVETVNEIKINEESRKTGGAYSMWGVNFDAKPGKDENGDYTIFPHITQYPFIIDIPFSALNGKIQCHKEHSGDKLDGYILPQNSTAVGICTQDVTDGDTVIHVNNTVLAMVEVDHIARITLLEMGTYRLSDKVEVTEVDYQNSTITVKYPINFEDGGVMLASNMIVVQLDNNIIGYITQPVTTNNRWIHVDSNSINYMLIGRWINLFQHNQNRTELRMITKIDKVNNKVMINAPFNIGMNPSDMTTYVQLTIKMIHNVELDSKRIVNSGEKSIGASSLYDVVIMLHYTNNGPRMNEDGILTSIKHCACELHILY